MPKPKKPGPKPVAKSRKFVGVILPTELLRRIDAFAAENFEGRSAAIRLLLESALRRKGM